MMASDFIIDVSEADFEYQVLAYSQNTPVVVDFWAEWCTPCRTLGPMLERLANEARGSFRLAKVNVDENPNLALRYSVRSIPAVKAFRDGGPVSEFTGLQPEPRLREFLRAIAPSQNDLNLEKGLSLLEMREAEKAESILRQVLEEQPANPAALLGLAKSLLLQGYGAEPDHLLASVPASREFSSAEALRPLAQALTAFNEDPNPEDDQPLDAAFHNALRLLRRGNLEAALDGLLDILREDKRYRNGKARQIFLAILELLDTNSAENRQYRSELASVLF
jgi:putative thioredoxin